MSNKAPKSRLKGKRGRTDSQTRWLKRQINDPYVARAKEEGYYSRAAFKLKEMDEKLHLLKNGMKVVDLGAAPGGWSQVLAKAGCSVVGIDLLDVGHVDGCEFLKMDFTHEDAPKMLEDLLQGKADLVVSDMAPNTTGHKGADHLRIIVLAEDALHFATKVLKPQGAFIAKILQGGAQGDLQAELKANFKTVKNLKPAASRKDSAECYVVALGFNG